MLDADTLCARVHSRFAGRRKAKVTLKKLVPVVDVRAKVVPRSESDKLMSRSAMVRALDYLLERDSSIENRISRRMALSFLPSDISGTMDPPVTRSTILAAVRALQNRGDRGTLTYKFLSTLSQKPPQGI